MLRKVILSLAAGAVMLSATACHTVKGFGRDVQSVGTATDSHHR